MSVEISQKINKKLAKKGYRLAHFGSALMSTASKLNRQLGAADGTRSLRTGWTLSDTIASNYWLSCPAIMYLNCGL